MANMSKEVTAAGHIRTCLASAGGILSILATVGMVVCTMRLEKNKRDFSTDNLPDNLPSAAVGALKIRPYALFGMGVGISIASILIGFLDFALFKWWRKNSSKISIPLEGGASLGMGVLGVLMVFALRYHGEENLFLYPGQKMGDSEKRYDYARDWFRFSFFSVFTTMALFLAAFIIHSVQLLARGGRKTVQIADQGQHLARETIANIQHGGRAPGYEMHTFDSRGPGVEEPASPTKAEKSGEQKSSKNDTARPFNFGEGSSNPTPGMYSNSDDPEQGVNSPPPRY